MSPPRRRISKDRHKRRSRSRSKERRRHEDRRSRSRSRDRIRRHRSRSPRYRSRSPRNRSYENHRSREREREKSKDQKYLPPKHLTNSYPISNTKSDVSLADMSNEEKDMMKLMGFCSFDSTKGKKVEGNDVGEVHVILKRKYRQYMNRKGGFNRPLDFVA